MIFIGLNGLCYPWKHCGHKMEWIFLQCNFALTTVMKKYNFWDFRQIWRQIILIRMDKKTLNFAKVDKNALKTSLEISWKTWSVLKITKTNSDQWNFDDFSKRASPPSFALFRRKTTSDQWNFDDFSKRAPPRPSHYSGGKLPQISEIVMISVSVHPPCPSHYSGGKLRPVKFWWFQ